MIKKISCFLLSFLVVVLVCSTAFLTSAVSDTKNHTWFDINLVNFSSFPQFLQDIVYASPEYTSQSYEEIAPFVLISVDNSKYSVYIGTYCAYGRIYTWDQSSNVTTFRNYGIGFRWKGEGQKKSSLYRAQFDRNNNIIEDWTSIDGTVYNNIDGSLRVEFLYTTAQADDKDLYFYGTNVLKGGSLYQFEHTSVTLAFSNSRTFNYQCDYRGFFAMTPAEIVSEARERPLTSFVSTFTPLTNEAYQNYLLQGSPPDPLEPSVDSSISDYENIEEQVGGDSFNMLEQATLPDLDALDGFSGSIGFVSNCMEMFTGFFTSDSSMSKISTVIMIVLSLGLVSFILNIVHSKE